MNQLLPYEKIISQKLEKLPAPDMQDAIWNSIQANLEASLPDMPNDGTSVAQGAAITTGKVVTGFIITVIIAAVTVVVASRKKKAKQNIKAVPEIMQPPAPVNDSVQQEGQKKNATVPFVKSDTGANVPPPAISDSALLISPVFPGMHQSDSNRITIRVMPAKDSFRNPPGNQPKKKTIGVTGISDSSYKISGKKDSM